MRPGAPGAPADSAVAGPQASAAGVIWRRQTSNVVILVLTLTSVAMGYYLLSRPGMLLGLTEYDDGAYFGTAVRLVHGVIPYRDFVVVQPPGLPLLLTPFAELSRAIGTRQALGLARLMMPLVLGAEVTLVGRVVRHRGTLPTLVACTAMAFFPDARDAAQTLMLEPFVALFCLAGTALVFDRGDLAGTRRIVLGGLAFGFGGAVKLWAIFPVLVVALLCLKDVRRLLAPFAAGVTAGFAVPCLPFLAIDPSAFVRDTIIAQLSRHLPASPTAVTRLTNMTGLDGFFHHPSSGEVAAVAVATAAVLLAGITMPGRRRTPLDWFAVGSCVVVAASLLEPAEFYYHYAAFLAPFLALALAVSFDRLTTVTTATALQDRRAGQDRTARSARWGPRAWGRRRPPLAPGLLAVLVAVAAVGLAWDETHKISTVSEPDYRLAVDPIVPSGPCIVSDYPALLLTTDRFEPDPPGCPQLVDSSGTALVLDSGSPPQIPGTVTPALVRVWMHAVRAADYLVLSHEVVQRIPFGQGIGAYVQSHFHLVGRSGLLIWVRDGWPDHG